MKPRVGSLNTLLAAVVIAYSIVIIVILKVSYNSPDSRFLSVDKSTSRQALPKQDNGSPKRFSLSQDGHSNVISMSSHQCGRTYSDSLKFRETYGKCSLRIDLALAQGTRRGINATTAYPPPFLIPQCTHLKWFLPHEACDLVGSIGKLSFAGDSLIRQLMVALGMVLTGNYRTGGLTRTTPPDFVNACQCERQFQCWQAPASHPFDGNTPQHMICPNWTRDHVLTTPLQDYNRTLGPVVVIGNGLAMHKGFGNTEAFYGEMEIFRGLAESTGGTYIPMTVHHPGRNKVEAYQKSQGDKQCRGLNDKIVQYANKHNLWILQTYEYTKYLWSRDGVHYDDENIVIVQLLLNQLWFMKNEQRISTVLESNILDPTIFSSASLDSVNIKAYTGSEPRPIGSTV